MTNTPNAAKVRSSYELWQATIDASIKDPQWHEYDGDLQRIAGEFNRHLSGNRGYFPLDWRMIKAMIWTESGGPDNPAWRNNPMQIGNSGDPGLAALLSGKAGIRKIIVGWNMVTTSYVAIRYNVGDPAYAKKLDYCLVVMRTPTAKATQCVT